MIKSCLTIILVVVFWSGILEKAEAARYRAIRVGSRAMVEGVQEYNDQDEDNGSGFFWIAGIMFVIGIFTGND